MVSKVVLVGGAVLGLCAPVGFIESARVIADPPADRFPGEWSDEWTLGINERSSASIGDEGQLRAASSMITVVDGWSIKPVYELESGRPRVIGMLVRPVGTIQIAGGLTAIWYERPSVECESWPALAYVTGSAWDAVQDIKARLGIQSTLDANWEVLPSPSAGTDSVEIDQGIGLVDPLRDAIQSLPNSVMGFGPSPRSHFLGMLQESGYSAADVPFERAGPEAAAAFLRSQARYYERVAERQLSPDEWSLVLAECFGGTVEPSGPTPPTLADDNEIGTPCPTPPGTFGCPAEYKGPWYSTERRCDCVTLGPVEFLSGTIRVNASGKLRFRLPFPPPLGTWIEFDGGGMIEIDPKICLWRRQCWAHAKRGIRYKLQPDCVWKWGAEEQSNGKMMFETVHWWMTTKESACSDAMRPAECPPSTQPCDQRVPVVHDPAPGAP